MIVASFDKTQNRTSAVSGAYQYDIGQRLVMHGLPSPSEMAEMDDLVSGDLVTVQAQFSYAGDSQAEMRLAMWDEKREAWMCDVPDDYLTRHRDVHVYVYVYYGSDETGGRAETAYEATFRPISRTAPGGVVTEDQLEQWERLKAEIEISLSKVDAAVEGAQTAGADASEAAQDAAVSAEDARKAAQAAKDALDALNTAGNKVGEAHGDTQSVAAGSPAWAKLDLNGSTGKLTIGAPKGAVGPKGETGDTGPADITVEFDTETGTLTITTKGEE